MSGAVRCKSPSARSTGPVRARVISATKDQVTAGAKRRAKDGAPGALLKRGAPRSLAAFQPIAAPCDTAIRQVSCLTAAYAGLPDPGQPAGLAGVADR
jgi:hypothetical protein